MISYKMIAKAISYYEKSGYVQLDAPWFVSREAMEVTAPRDSRYCSCFLGDLVASGEQSFLEMHRQNKLYKGKYQCATPCFRDEPVVNYLTKNYFFKVELIEVYPDDIDKSLQDMIDCALNFFNEIPVEVINTQIGFDIVYKGIELGSYGYREHGFFKWIYGTGIAEPRFSQAVGKHNLTNYSLRVNEI